MNENFFIAFVIVALAFVVVAGLCCNQDNPKGRRNKIGQICAVIGIGIPLCAMGIFAVWILGSIVWVAVGPAGKERKMETACRTVLQDNTTADLTAYCAPFVAKIDGDRAAAKAEAQQNAEKLVAVLHDKASRDAADYVRANMPK